MGKIKNIIYPALLFTANLLFISYVWIYELDRQQTIAKEYYLYLIEGIAKNNSINSKTIAEKIEYELKDFTKKVYYFKGNDSFQFLNGKMNLIQFEKQEIDRTPLDAISIDCPHRRNCLLIIKRINSKESWRTELEDYLKETYKFLTELQIFGLLILNLIGFLIYFLKSKMASGFYYKLTRRRRVSP